MSEEKFFRNREIFFKKVVEHKSISEIAEMYGLSNTRVRQLIKQVREGKNLDNDIPEIRESCKKFNTPIGMHKRICNALERKGFVKNNKWRKLSREELLEIPNLGEMSVDIILNAQKM